MGRFTRLSGLAVLLAGLVPAGVADAAAQEATQPADQKQAQPAPQKAQPPRVAWIASCTSPGRGQPQECAMEQRAIAKENGQLIGLVSIRVPSETRKPVTMIQLPLNLFLPAGVNVDVDGDMTQNQSFQTCNQTGCFVGFPISDTLLKQLFNGGKLNVTFQYLDKKPVTLPMSLEGFTDAYNRIK
ncbi:invasion associated locus B family protein [Taklimakanibacter lacteus]|uniref:invasion associated locus B family protein n=1 Tax=Taklimakanibacter lacteus TaxID=2268456 RepID=UPI0013C496C5